MQQNKLFDTNLNISTINVIVGLGNPGNYNNTYHNLGFNFVDFIAKNKIWLRKDNYLYTKVDINYKPYILCKPQTYMNLSGQAINGILSEFCIKKDNLLIVHDELNLELYQYKFKMQGSFGGHNGLKSIGQYLGHEFMRLRLGISHPKENVAEYVLKTVDLSGFQPVFQEIEGKLRSS